jgi:HK97 family phage portal protein
MNNALTRAFNRLITRTTSVPAEGQVRPGPYYLPVSNGFLPAGSSWNFWQRGYDVTPLGTRSAMVEACVSAYAQTAAMCVGDHWRKNNKGGRNRVTTSALSRILRDPNDYQSISDFLLNAVRSLYLEGNAIALCLRNDRYEISELHLMDWRQSLPQIAQDGSIFYSLGGNPIIENRLGSEFFATPVPARDILHIRLHTSAMRANPLIGESPIWAAANDIAAGDAVMAQQLAFFNNAARPSFILSTDLLLEKDQVEAARERWDQLTTGENVGRTPILTGGLKPQLITMRARDAQVAEIMKMSREDIALAFRVPFALLGISGSPAGSAEALMQQWIATGLGFCLNHVEEAFDLTFQLAGQPSEYVEFDTEALLRSAFRDRISALKEGVQGGIFSPNEARNKEGLDNVAYGDEPRTQQQVVPLSAAAGISAGAPPSGKTIIPPAPPAPPASGSSGASGPPPTIPVKGSPRSLSDATRNNVRELLRRSARYKRRDDDRPSA